eukprot:205346_1
MKSSQLQQRHTGYKYRPLRIDDGEGPIRMIPITDCCCGICSIYVGIFIASCWNILFSMLLLELSPVTTDIIDHYTFDYIYIALTNIYSRLLTYLVIPALIRISLGIIGFILLLQMELCVIKYSIFIDLYTFFLVWTPMLTVLFCGIEFILMAQNLETHNEWDLGLIEDALRDKSMLKHLALCIFLPWIVDVIFMFYYFLKFKEFIETSFRRRIHVCCCHVVCKWH